jgi:hypothetical protein
VLDILEQRIAAAQAGQDSRDAFLESLDPESGCAEWAGAQADRHAWRRDREVLAAIRDVCPGSPPPAREGVARERSAVRGSPQLRLRAAGWQTVRPRGDGLEEAEASAEIRSAWAGGEAAGGRDGLRTRRAWIRDPGGRWELQAGRLAFAPAEASISPGPPRPSPVLPRLDFVSGRRSFPGHSARSGVDGPLEARVPALDGAGLTARLGPHSASLFGSWNRLEPDGPRPPGPRLDVLSHALVLAGPAGPLLWAAQFSHQRLEPSRGDPASALVAGAVLAAPKGFRLGAAVSALWPRGGPLEAAGSASPRGPAETGAYGEAGLSDGKHGRYSLEVRQATAGWASPLADVPALTRDTLESGWILPGRGEGGLRLRSRLPLAEGPGPAVALAAAGEAAWGPGFPRDPADGSDRLLAGDGRLALHLAWMAWRYEAGAGLGWRVPDLSASGSTRTLSQSLRWRRGGFGLGATLSRRLRTGRSPREEGREETAWPAACEAAWTGGRAGSLKAALSATDLAHPGRGLRISMRQDWNLGGGVSLAQSLRLPWESGGLQKDMGFQLKFEITGG